jgi:hypothetical protein
MAEKIWREELASVKKDISCYNKFSSKNAYEIGTHRESMQLEYKYDLERKEMLERAIGYNKQNPIFELTNYEKQREMRWIERCKTFEDPLTFEQQVYCKYKI